MSFGFSIGDLTAAISISRKLSAVPELRDSGKDSLAEILQRLEAILIKVQELKPPNNISRVQYHALIEVSSQCQASLDKFVDLSRLRDPGDRGRPYLLKSLNTSQGKLRKWSQKAITTFRAEITGHLLSLTLLNNVNE